MKQIGIIMIGIMMSSVSYAQKKEKAIQFKHSVTTTASAEQIWHIWTDVQNWHQWDSGLKSATLKAGIFKVDAKGSLIPDKGPKAKFIISEVVEGHSYTFKTKIPFGWLIVKRYLKQEGDQVVFTHDVQFTGLLKGMFGKMMGAKYKEMLPQVMEKVKEIAEQSGVDS